MFFNITFFNLKSLFVALFTLLIILNIHTPQTFAVDKQDGLFFKRGINLIPEPKSATLTNETTYISRSLKTNMTVDIDPFIKNFLEMEIVLSDEKGGIKECTLELVAEEEFESVKTNKQQAYRLLIEEKEVKIKAISNEGLFYGAQTFLQLLLKNEHIPLGEMLDWPDLAWRAVHFDTKHHQDRFEYYQDIIPKLAKYKINAIVFEIEDKLKYIKHPQIAAQGAFTKQQMRELADLAGKHYIDFIPLVQGLGHVRYITKHPEYAHLRELPESTWQVCPLKDDSYKLLFDLYDEAIEATGTKVYFHIGGDESYDLGMCSDCRKRAEKNGKGDVYLVWLNKVAKYLEKKGLKVIIWDDMVFQFDENNLKKLPENVIYMRWEYDKKQVEKTELFKRGMQCMVAPAVQCTTPIFPDYENRLQNIAYYVPSGRDAGALGSLCTAWDDSGLNMETFWLGFVASAEYAWSGDTPGLAEFQTKFMSNFYGPNAQDMQTVYNILSQSGEFWHNSRGRLFWKRSAERQPIQFPALPNVGLYHNSDWDKFVTNENGAYNWWGETSRLERLYDTAEQILFSNISKNVDNKLNLQILLSVTRMMQLNADVLMTRYQLAQDYADASRFVNEGELEKASERLEKAIKAVDLLLAQKKSTESFLKESWQKNQYPRDRSDLGRPMPYYVDRYRLHFAELSANYDYMFWVEKMIDLEKYLEDLKDVKQEFDENIKKSRTNSWRENSSRY